MAKVALAHLLSRHPLAVPVVKKKIHAVVYTENNQSINLFCCLKIGER